MATSVGDIFLDLKLNKQPFEKGLNETKASAGIMGKKLGLAIAGGIATAVGAVSFASLISKTAQVGDAIDKMSQKLGMYAQTYQEWDYVMERCGASMDSMTTAMKTLASSAETSKDAFDQLGISQAEISSLSQEELFARTIQALQQVEDTTQRTYLAGQLLGRGATELGALLNMSAQDTTALRQNLYSLGGVMSQTAVANSAQLADAMTDARMSFRGLSNTLAESVLPVITSAIYSVIIPAIQRASAVLRYFVSLWNSVFGAIGKRVSAIGGMFGKVGSGIKSVFGKAQQKQNAQFGKSLGGVSKGVGGAGKSAKKAKKAVKELNRELMGFDKINKLAKKNSSAGGGGAGGGGGGGGGGIGDLGAELGDTNAKLFDFSKLTEKLAPITKALGEVFKAVLRLFKAVAKALIPVGKWIWKHLIKPFGKLLSMAIVAVLEGIAGAINLLARFIEKHPKISVILGAVAGGLLAITHAGSALGIISKFAKVFGVLSKVIMAHPIGLLLTAIALAIGYIYQNWNKIKKTKFGKALIKIGNTLKQIGSYLAGTFLKKFEQAKKLVQGFKDAWTGIKSKAVELKAKVGEVVGDVWEGISDTVATITVKLKDDFSGAWDKIKNTWDNLQDKTATVTTYLKGATEKAYNAIASAFNSVKTKTATLTTKLVNNIKSKTLTALKNAFSTIKSKTVTLAVSIKAGVAKGYNAVAKKYNSLRAKINKLPGMNLPALPLLAQGGWIDKNTPQLAVVGDNRHEAEIVAPDSKLMAMARQASMEAVSNSSNAQVVALLSQLLRAVQGMDTNIYLDGKQIAKNTIKQINQQTRTTGQFPLIV